MHGGDLSYKQSFVSHREKYSRSGHHRAIQCSKSRNHNRDRNEVDPGIADDSESGVGGDELRARDLTYVEQMQISEIGQQVNRDDRQGAAYDRSWQIARGIFHFAAQKRNIRPSI